MTSRPARVLLLLAAVSLLLIALDRWTPLDPLRRAGSLLYGTTASLIAAATRIGDNADRLRALERENAALRAGDLARRQTPAAIPLPDPAHRGLPAHAVGFAPGTITIDIGTGDGITRDLTVLNADGLIGRVTWAGPTTATVSLLTDRASSIGARLPSGEVGTITGHDDLLLLRLLNPQAALAPGDRVTTLGSDNHRPYVPGVPIGEVIRVEPTPGASTQTALVRPYAALTTVDLVTVVLP
ncbi:rod shape-determining protein MreC [Acrocarpospora sp. B8E8]|uniref:rod shape-determining protein MreC n=1 Tax=Acrocarpospora sp. B8E8 TaxID=3153572 RepID=UPI00325DFB2E